MSKNSLQAKPLKGSSFSGTLGAFDTISANNVIFSSSSVEALIEGAQLDGVTIVNSEVYNTVIGANGASEGYFTKLSTSNDVVFYSLDKTQSVSWDAGSGLLKVQGDLSVSGCGLFGNIDICQNTIQAINTNGDINIIPNGLGTLYLTGPVYNMVTSSGNYFTSLSDGNVTFLASDFISLTSNKSYANISSFSDQNFTTTNGDITLSTETGIGIKFISKIDATGGNIRVTTAQNSNVRVGDTVTLSGTSSTPNFDGSFLVSNILTDNSFNISTNSPILSNSTTGTLVKKASNNINLNASVYVSIPSNIKLTFGNTTSSSINSISGDTSGLLVRSQGDVMFSIPTNGNVVIPQSTKFQLGTSGNNNVNFDGTSLNLNSINKTTISGNLTQINTTNTRLKDPILTLADYTSSLSDNTDRGIEYRYYDSSSGNMKLGWFGYKASTDEFTFIPDATNNNEIISGNAGRFSISDISASNISLKSGGTFDLGCGFITNVNTITGCSGTININSSNNVNITTGSRLSLISGGDIFIPNNIPLNLGSSGSSLKEGTSGNVILTGFRNTRIVTQTNGAVILQTGTKLSFDGTSIGNQNIVSDTPGNLIINTNKNLFINLTTGNLVFPSNDSSNVTQNSLQFGSQTFSETICGNSSGIKIITNSSFGALNFIANSNVNLTTSSGNVLISSYAGDIDLFSTQGNVRLLPLSRIVFGISGTSNSIRTNTAGTFMIYGPGTSGNSSNVTSGNTLELKNALNINIQPVSGGNVNIPTNVFLNVGNSRNSYIIADTSSNFNLVNNSTNGNINISAFNTLLTNTNNLIVSNNQTNISSQNVVIDGANLIVNADNIKFKDPILSLANYTTIDNKDRGIEYNWYDRSSGNTKLGWFGYKNSTGRFVYYSDAINNGEVISGTTGQFELGSAVISDSLTFLNAGNIDMNCGTISNLNTITGCNGTINLLAPNSINATAASINLNATNKVLIPFNTPLAFGNTSNSVVVSSNGNFIITAMEGAGTIVLNSNVQINGTTSNVHSTITNIQDPIFSLGGVSGPTVNDGKDRGIEFKWYNNNSSFGSIGTKTGFFGMKNSLDRFVFIPDGTNVNEVYFGSYGSVQFDNGFFNNIDVNGGNLSNVNTISNNGGINITGNFINISSGNVSLPPGSKLNFGSTSNSVSADINGNLSIISKQNTSLTSQSGGINFVTNTNGTGFVSISENSPLNFGTSGTYLIKDTTGTLNVINSSGNIILAPQNLVNGTFGSINIPTNNSINFSGTNSNNRISSDGEQLQLYGYSAVGINSSTVTISGNVNIVGNLTAGMVSSDLNAYILPLGTSQNLKIIDISNDTNRDKINITTESPNYLSVGDKVTLKNTNSIPIVDDDYFVIDVISNSTFSILHDPLISPGNTGRIKSVLTTYQGKDVGIEVDYWSTVGNTSVTSGSANYKTGFFGWKNDTERWTFYHDTTIVDNVVTQGNLGDVEINHLFTNKISGFTLDGPIVGGNYTIAGSNFQISGGNADNLIIGQTTAQSGRFTNLSSTISSSLENLTLQSTLKYSFERYTLSSLVPTRNPSINTIVSFFSVSGVSFTTPSGTMATTAVSDGQVKKVICSSMGNDCQYTLYFGPGKLITPNPLGGVATKIIFKRQAQNCELIFDAVLGSWILLNGSAKVE